MALGIVFNPTNMQITRLCLKGQLLSISKATKNNHVVNSKILQVGEAGETDWKKKNVVSQQPCWIKLLQTA